MDAFKYFLALCAGCLLGAVAVHAQIPAPLRPGDKIAIVTPASAIGDSAIIKAAALLEARGYRPVVMPHAMGKSYGSYPATDHHRAEDFNAAIADPEVRAIICSRGGYGCNHILPLIDVGALQADPKWIVGYSDISAIHALLSRSGIASIHGPMCGHLANAEADSLSTARLFEVLESPLPHPVEIDPSPYNNPGTAEGVVVGGNLLVINGLSETPCDILNPPAGELPDRILFIEDVGEKIYAIERVLTRLHQSGALSRVKAIVIGEFTDYSPDDNFETMEEMISYRLHRWGHYDIPLVFGYPAGHGDRNIPVILGARAKVTVTPDVARIEWE